MQLRSKLIIDYYVGSLLYALLKPPTILAGRILRRDHDLKRCTDVTVVKMLGGGSLVIAYPALLAIKQAPGIRRLRLLTTPAVQPFALLLGLFDEIIVIRDDAIGSLLRDALVAIRRLFRCDAIVDLEVHSRLTTVLSLVTCARNRVGFYTGSSFWRRQIVTHLLFCNLSNGIYQSYDQIALLLGGKAPDLDECRAHFRAAVRPPTGGADQAIRRIALAPCCSKLSEERMLQPGEWVRILRRRRSPNEPPEPWAIDLLGGAEDRANLELLVPSLREAFPYATVANLGGELSLADSVRRLAGADELFCIDSALLHCARLLGTPTVSFWGPTDPRSLLRPWPQNRDEIHYHKLPCSPCVHLAQQPPCGGDNLCMRACSDPEWRGNPNPAWVVADARVRRFLRSSAP